MVKIQHLIYKDLCLNFKFEDSSLLKEFLNTNYDIKNFRIHVYIDYRIINISDIVSIYNLNPYLENIKLEDLNIIDSKQFLKKFDINNYEITHEVYKDIAEEEAAYYIYMKNENNDYDVYLFPDFEKFYYNLNKIKESNIEHTYLVEPSIITVEQYLKVLSLYGEFKNLKFKNSFEINQYINDIRTLSNIKKPEKIIVEIT